MPWLDNEEARKKAIAALPASAQLALAAHVMGRALPIVRALYPEFIANHPRVSDLADLLWHRATESKVDRDDEILLLREAIDQDMNLWSEDNPPPKAIACVQMFLADIMMLFDGPDLARAVYRVGREMQSLMECYSQSEEAMYREQDWQERAVKFLLERSAGPYNSKIFSDFESDGAP